MANKKSRKLDIIGELSRGFTQRTVPEGYMDDPLARRAYGDYFGEVGFEKGAAFSREIRNRKPPGLFGSGRLSMVDLGTGTGEFVRGLSEGLLPDIPGGIDLLCVDRSLSALQEFSGQWARPEGISLRLVPALLPEAPDLPRIAGPVDVLSMANLLAENEDRLSGFLTLLKGFLERLSPGGLMILVEPADRRSSRSLLGLGDRLLDLFPDLRILAPCPNDRRGPCPSLASPDGWCHEDRPAAFSRSLTQTASSLGHVKDSLKMTYLILSRGEKVGDESGEGALRLVSPLHKEKGMSWGVFCDGTTLFRLRLKTRNRNEDTRAFFRLKRGETIRNPGFSSEKEASDGAFADWPSEIPLTGLFRPDGTPFHFSRKEE